MLNEFDDCEDFCDPKNSFKISFKMCWHDGAFISKDFNALTPADSY